ncbi:hypothetical protein MUN78_16470 [Leucobacter allii]|uniref:Antitoxin VbhA domain-containing protein n=1 Tax=Leucobacter allii TaxID=2932247 RepID=A0ABY4FLY5_9MICO|nr:hypothetical protein [Leucobacter allii]UOQ57225.1 hypothetical protein MUN78_16470 [Leucobacter allii]
MSEYTPSVEEARNAWIEYQTEVPSDGAYIPMSVEDAVAQWDRMIAEVERAVVERERAAIGSAIGAYTESGVGAFEQAVGCIDRERREENEEHG